MENCLTTFFFTFQCFRMCGSWSDEKNLSLSSILMAMVNNHYETNH